MNAPDRITAWTAANQALLAAEFDVLKARLTPGNAASTWDGNPDGQAGGQSNARDVEQAEAWADVHADKTAVMMGVRADAKADRDTGAGADAKTSVNTGASADRNADVQGNAYPDAEAALHAARAAMPARAPIDALTDAFSLSPFERSLVLLVAGAEMDAELADLCGHAVGQPQHPWATFGLALNLLPDPHWSALARTQPLRRWRLIEVESDSALVTARLRLDERVLHYLAGMNLMDARLLPLLRAMPSPMLLAESHAALAEAIAGQLIASHDATDDGAWLAGEGAGQDRGEVAHAGANAGVDADFYADADADASANIIANADADADADADAAASAADTAAVPAAVTAAARRTDPPATVANPSRRPPLLFLHGDDASGREDVAARCAALLGLRMHALDAQGLPGGLAELADVAVLWEREAALGAGALFIACDDDAAVAASGQNAGGSAALPDASVMARAKAFADMVDGLIFMGARTPIALRRDTRFHAVDRPSAAEQRALWTAALGSAAAGREAEIEAVAAQFRLSARGIASAAAAALPATAQVASGARMHAASPAPSTAPSNAAGALWQACRERASAPLGELAHRIVARATWDDLVLPAAQKATLGQIVTHVRHRRQVLETWGFADRGGRGLGITVLFAGDSGTGKTFAAEVLATELSLDLFRVDVSGVVSKYIGETEKNLRRVFDAAEESGALLLFDEADALFGKRSEVRDSHDRYANVEVSYLLQRMESYRGLAILTTNHKAALDSAFMRRLRFVVQFPFPETAEREAIWRRAFPQATPVDGLAFDKLARLQASGGQIQNMALGAAFLAAADGGAVTMAHVLDAVRTDGTRFDRPVSDTETRGWV